ncbi:MAG: endolytic transglycosylase MltG [Pseudomonadota bacterium]
MRTLRLMLLWTFAAVLALGIVFGIAFKKFLATPLITADQGFRYQVHMGASFKSMANDLTSQHILSNPYFFCWLVLYRHDLHNLKAGEYFFPKGTKPNQMITQVVTGTGLIYHAFTIVPGTTFHQLRQALNNSNELMHTSRKLSDATIMQRLGQAKLNPEGWFFPDTYYFVVDSSDMILLHRALVAMQNKLTQLWLARSPNLPFQTSYQALIAASIIEKEAHLKQELPIIAGVMVNRLHKDMLLQFDPTVIYGVGEHYDGVIHQSDLHNVNPYNSYLNKGLPPTPISMPGLAALDAVMHPDVNDYLFFVARGEGGSHQFSRTLVEHVQAVAAARKYRASFFNSALVEKYVMRTLKLKIVSTN